MSVQRSYFSEGSSTKAPSAWTLENEENNARTAKIKENLEISGTRVKYIGQGKTDDDASAIRSNFPVPDNCPLYVYEVEIISSGVDGLIGIGFSTHKVNLARLPGWDVNSYGYHGDDGCRFPGRGQGEAYGPTFTTGDIIGVIWDRERREISYSKNGAHLGVAFSNVSEEVLYPTVGFRTKDEEVKANFGESQFLLDVDSLWAEKRRAMMEQISRINLEDTFKIELDKVLPSIVIDYLIHHRYWKTFSVVAQDLLDKSENADLKNIESITIRQKIYDAVINGNIDEAFSQSDAVAPGALKKYPSLVFKLRVQKFIEMVKNKEDQHSAVQYGKTYLSPACETTEDNELLQDALTLIAYEDPEESPCRYLLDPMIRISIAEELNNAILEQEGKPKKSAFETIYRQLMVVLEELKEVKDMGSQFVDFEKILRREQESIDNE